MKWAQNEEDMSAACASIL